MKSNFNREFLTRQANRNDLGAVVLRQGAVITQQGHSFVKFQSLDEVATAVAGQAVFTDATGIHIAADTYPSSAFIDWKAIDNDALIGKLVGSYAGALTNSGLLLFGQAHDSGVKGLVYLAANDHNGTTKTSIVLDTSGVITADMRSGTNTALNTQGFNIKTKVVDNNDINNVIYVDSESASTPAAGFGSAISYRAENAGHTLIDMGYFGFKWTTAAAGNESSKAVIGVKDGGANVDVLAVSKLGVDAINANVRSFTATIGDDAATSFTPLRTAGGIMITTGGTGNGGIGNYNTVTPTMQSVVGGANFAVTTGVLSGTTGTDTKLTLSAHTDGKIYVENRTGQSRNVYVILI
jgi:hypothetical protein